MRRFTVYLLSALLLCSSLGARAAGVSVVQQPDPSADLVGTEIVLQAGLDRQTAKQNGLAALVAQSILQTPVQGGKPLEDAIAANGGSISYVVDPRSVRFYVEGLNGSYAALLTLFHTALTKPDFSARTIAAARTALEGKIVRSARMPLDVGIDMLNRAFYRDSAGMPPYGLPATLAGFAPSDAQAFYQQHYRRGDAVISAVGNLASVAGNPFGGLVDGLPAGTSPQAGVRMAKLPSSTRELLARRDISVPWLVAQYPAPDIMSKDFGAMLILTSFMQRTLGEVSEVPTIATKSAAQRGVGAYYNFDARPANVILYVDGGLGDPTRTFATALTVVNVLGHAKLGGNLSDMKSYAVGRLLQDTTTLQDRAWFAAVYAAHGVTGDYFAHAIKAINATTAADLQRVAGRYLGAPTIALVLPRAQQSVQSPTP
ncbi:MAG TPA: insulinase family protein [Candidatus Baltobacteraceae bacterium]|nr:insulinase family protein [Candidatus Baltobacteraceae bacterium]